MRQRKTQEEDEGRKEIRRENEKDCIEVCKKKLALYWFKKKKTDENQRLKNELKGLKIEQKTRENERKERTKQD